MGENAGPRPWMIAAWPGMGSVAVIAAGYLVQKLGMVAQGELPSRDHFDISEITVKKGLVTAARLPRGLFFRWANPKGGRPLVVFLGEAQPATGTYAYSHELIDAAVPMGIERVITFASMASALHPAENPKVIGVATDRSSLRELQKVEVQPLKEGQIGGLNGVVLAAAAERGLSGVCLMAEIPFFAAGVPNPKAARAALSVFSILADIEVSLDELNEHAAAVDRMLIDAYEKLKEQGAISEEEPEEGEEGDEGAPETTPTEPSTGEPPAPSLDYASRQRLERMFDEARRDHSRAMALKQELDRLGVFKQYEDRFLDLFRRAG